MDAVLVLGWVVVAGGLWTAFAAVWIMLSEGPASRGRRLGIHVRAVLCLVVAIAVVGWFA